MRLLYIDVDTMRADHLGCYGYVRNTSPNMDRIASDGVRLDQVYVSDSPCLPSRTALATGRFGILTGVVNHGGRRAEPFAAGAERGRRSVMALESWPNLLASSGMWTASISTFAERHSAFHWYSGLNEVYNLGTDGLETADEVAPVAIDWLSRNGRRDDWFLHVHMWDPHTPYRTPKQFGHPFEDDPYPAWIDDSVIEEHRRLAGPHSAQEVAGFGPEPRLARYKRQPQEIVDQSDVKRMFDGYDTGIRYADHHIGRILDVLDQLGLYEDTAVLISSDHGETLGELGIYCDHQTADEHTHHVPAILKFPGIPRGLAIPGLRYQIDLAATIAELCGASIPSGWNGSSFADGLRDGSGSAGRTHLVLSGAAWATQRSVRFDNWICIRTYHDAFHDFPPVSLYDLAEDPHERTDLAESRPDIVAQASRLLLEWQDCALADSLTGIDPLHVVLAEGGGYYTRGRLDAYRRRLKATGREDKAAKLAATHG